MLNRIKEFVKKLFMLLEIDVASIKRDHSGRVSLFKKKFHYHNKTAFQITYNEIFGKGIYTFIPKNKYPVIIDCGANLGVSLLFFSMHYPNAIIYAFEPDVAVLEHLKKNIETYMMKNVRLFEKAVWDVNGLSEFYTDQFLGARLEKKIQNIEPARVETIRLKDFIGIMHVDLLKLDIEGAELRVIQDCEPILSQIDHVFVEYHSIKDEEQHLDHILQILKKNGFRYHLSESFSRSKPFIEKNVAAEIFDLTINIYGYREYSSNS